MITLYFKKKHKNLKLVETDLMPSQYEAFIRSQVANGITEFLTKDKTVLAIFKLLCLENLINGFRLVVFHTRWSDNKHSDREIQVDKFGYFDNEELEELNVDYDIACRHADFAIKQHEEKERCKLNTTISNSGDG